MPTSSETIDLLLEKCRLGGELTAKKMFGEYGLFCDGKMFAIVGDDQLFLKSTDAGLELFPDAEQVAPYPGAKPCLLIPPSRWENEEWMGELVSQTTSQLPEPKKRKK